MKRLSITIYNKEALTSKGPQDLFDPVSITVFVMDKDETLITKPQPVRLSQGHYIAEVDETLFTAGETYNVIWDYYLHEGCEQVQRFSFKFETIPAEIAGLCRINGSVGPVFPVAGARVEWEVLKDGYSSHFAQTHDVALTDAFGDWVVYVPQARTCQIVIPDVNDRKIFLAPTVTAAAYDDLTPLLTPVITDGFGNVV